MWLIAGVGAVAVAFALVLAFALPLLIYQFRKPSWATNQATVSGS